MVRLGHSTDIGVVLRSSRGEIRTHLSDLLLFRTTHHDIGVPLRENRTSDVEARLGLWLARSNDGRGFALNPNLRPSRYLRDSALSVWLELDLMRHVPRSVGSSRRADAFLITNLVVAQKSHFATQDAH